MSETFMHTYYDVDSRRQTFEARRATYVDGQGLEHVGGIVAIDGVTIEPGAHIHEGAVVAPKAFVGRGAEVFGKMDAGSFLGSGAVVAKDGHLGPGSRVLRGSQVAGKVCEGCEIGPGATVYGDTITEQNCSIGAGATIGSGTRIHAGAEVPRGENVPESTQYRPKSASVAPERGSLLHRITSALPKLGRGGDGLRK